MTRTSNRLVFLGSGPVAAKSLTFLADRFDISLVITKSKADWHKDPAPVEESANKLGLSIAYANNAKDLLNFIDSKNFKSTLALVVDFGVLIPEHFIKHFELGIINSHFSLLPEWRGADPISYALLSGQKFSGVSLMLIDSGLDTGKLLASTKISVSPHDDNCSLTAKLIEASNQLISKTLSPHINGKLKPYEQPSLPVTYSNKINKNDGLLDWHKNAHYLVREVRAYSEWPQSWFVIKNKRIFVKEAVVSNLSLKVGEFRLLSDRIVVGCRNSSIGLNILRPEGKQIMNCKDFINGYRYLF